MLTNSSDTAAVERINHVAIVVADFDATVRMLTDALGMRCARLGKLGRDESRRIAMITDGTGFKLEIIEAPAPEAHEAGPAGASPAATFDHIAVRVRDVDETHERLQAIGFAERMAPRRLEPAHARTALLAEPHGMHVQIIRYDDTSPDI